MTEEDALRVELMAVDIMLKRKQAFWETPRNIAILLATVGAVAGALGFKLGQTTPAAPTIIVQMPKTSAT